MSDAFILEMALEFGWRCHWLIWVVLLGCYGLAVARHAEAWIETSPKYFGSRLQVGRRPGRVDVTGPVS